MEKNTRLRASHSCSTFLGWLLFGRKGIRPGGLREAFLRISGRSYCKLVACTPALHSQTVFT